MASTEHPVPQETARYDTDPAAHAWARTRVQHQLDRLTKFEEQATAKGDTEKASGLAIARRSTAQLLLGGEGCVVGAFDERRPVMLAEQSAGDTLPAWLYQRFDRGRVGAWPDLTDDDREYWAHAAAAVRRAVARGGFKAQADGEQEQRPELCPRCTSPAPHLHPATQADGGEVQPCTDPWHLPTAAPDPVPPTLAALRDLIAADPGAMTIFEALASARTLLAAHARELAEHVDGLAAPDCADMSSLDDAWECGNTDTATALRQYADDLEQQATGGEV